VKARVGRQKVYSIFFGGGTPSLMQPKTVASILDHIAKLWPIQSGAEITLEANPNSVEAERFAGYRAAGVNRVSIGVQSLKDEELKRLGRLHSVAEARTAIDIARRTFDRFTFDLIYARPGQTLFAWRTELTEALAMGSNHLSLYQLTIEPDTPFAELHARGKLIIPDPDAALDLYALTQDLTAAAGLPAYEISNHARPGQESRHNLLYWRYGAYAGIGPGAHGRLVLPDGCRIATATERNPERWAERVETAGHGFTDETPLSREEQADEMLLMGLRLTEGIDLDAMARRFGFAPSAAEIADLEKMGLIEILVHEQQHPDIIRACVGPGISPAATTAYAARHPTIRAIGQGRFVLNELVRRLSLETEPVAVPVNTAATLRT
jgi:oxygen-independent coproporphyrinogen-3 oxidase